MIKKSKIPASPAGRKNQKSKLHSKNQNFGFCPPSVNFRRTIRQSLSKGGWIVILIFELWILNFNCYAKPVTSQDLIENAKDYDGKTVKFCGEIIGDIMKRGDFVWINVSDEDNAIGAWIPIDLANEITFKGDYKHIGDSVEIVGEFHRACLQHNGELDIHAEKLSILKKGEEKPELISRKKQKTAFVFLGVAICLGILRMLIGRYKKT